MELHTQDLVLRTPLEADLAEVRRMWRMGAPVSEEDARQALEKMARNLQRNRPGRIHHLCLAVFKSGSDEIIGWCGLDGTSGDKLHIFYMIAEEHRRRGYATQCAARLLTHAFEEAQVPFVNGGCDKENTASFRVMEKCGMLQNAFEDNGDPLFYMDADIYRRTKGGKR